MNESKATRYQRSRRRADAAALASSAAVLALIALTPASRALADWTRGFVRGLAPVAHEIVTVAIFAALVTALCELAALAARLVLERRAARSQPRTHAEDLLGGYARAAVTWMLAAIAGAVAVRLAVAVAGRWWWLAAGVLIAAGLVGVAHGVAPLLARAARARGLDRPDLAARLTDLARRAGVGVRRIEELRGDHASLTALVTGLGRSRRIFLSSELVRDWSDDEVAVVVAHEIAHQAHHDLARTLALDAALVAAALGAADLVLARVSPWMGWAAPFDLAALPLISAVAGVVWLAATPLRHAESRRQERLADAMALGLTGGADAFGAALRRLGERRLAEERPSALTRWLYHRHPSVQERLAMADAYKRSGIRHASLGTRH
jgi:Zn-dependent protease with chaperone function